MKKDNSKKGKKKQNLTTQSTAMNKAIKRKVEALDRYIDHLLTDFQKAANKTPKINSSPDKGEQIPKGLEWVVEVRNSPYQTIAEWTGIPLEELPNETHLTSDQIDRLVAGLDELWAAWSWYFDLGEHLPNTTVRYRMYLECWTDIVQYLPNLGFEVELCYGGDPKDCRMGEDCICLLDTFNS